MSQGDTVLINMLTGLLEDAVKALQRIERKVEDQTITFKNILQKIDTLEKKFDSEFAILSQRSIPEMQQVLTEEIESLGLQDLNEIEIAIDHILNKLQKSIQILTIQGLVRRIENLSMPVAPRVVEKVVERVASSTSQTAPASTSSTQTTSAPAASSTEGTAPVSTAPAVPPQQAEEDGEDHNLRPSSFFGS
ncbi:MAG: hypothetical protein ACTSRW_05140 [Candidatus Helarchaeota archaeon]